MPMPRLSALFAIAAAPVHFLLLVALVGANGLGCTSSRYDLPDPPPASERSDVSLIPGDDDRQARRDYLEARAAALELHNLLATQRFKEASEAMSRETIDFLTHGSGDATVAEVLARGELKLPNGEVVEFDPTSMLLASDLSSLEDTLEGVGENETASRKEIFAILPSGKAQRIVLIKETGRWTLHRTRLPESIELP